LRRWPPISISNVRPTAAAIRVHDVRETVQALKVWAALDQVETTPVNPSG
jgi:dihydropteroate synthase